MKPYMVFLGLGSNVGDRPSYLKTAVAALQKVPELSVVATSSVYESDPYGKTDQPKFLNAVLEIETSLSPDILFAEMKRIEMLTGRTRQEHWGPREVDIDILLYDGLVFRNDDLSVPHADLENRKFVLVPFSELAPDVVHPVSGLTIAEMAANCRDKGRVTRSLYHIVL
jgi:2-amino-4-hydroxy-6-hydroxymethyldihydropteridine diphosphokinase